MSGGIIIGGWEYVIAAYGITFTALGAYTASLLLRTRAAKRRQDQEPSR